MGEPTLTTRSRTRTRNKDAVKAGLRRRQRQIGRERKGQQRVRHDPDQIAWNGGKLDSVAVLVDVRER